VTTPPESRPQGVPRASPWVRRLVAEIVRGRHVILHGNVHDVALWDYKFLPVAEVLRQVLAALGFELVGKFDQIDGLSFGAEEDSKKFTDLLGKQGSSAQPPADSPARPGAGDTPDDTGSGGSRADRAGAARRQMAGSLASATTEPVRYQQPRDALAAIRRGLAQASTPIAFVLDFADLLLLDPEHHDRTDRDLLLLVKKAMMESAQARNSAVSNLLMLITSDLATIPSWLYHDEPFVRPLEIPLPSYDERRAYLESQAHRYFDFKPGPHNREPVRVLANLTEGMALSELSGLQRTSRLDKLPLASARELVNRAVFGQREDPWARLVERVPQASEILARRVIGQPVAVERVSRGLAAATLGIDFVADPFSVEARPKGVFFFAGPTGVGKTELCRALSSLIFDDETALIRFDMSTFAQEHAAERLTGAPPGYVGHERGGELTNRVTQRPFSVLLFDEIEKANAAVYDKFLQILEDGRLTDGLGQTTYFSQTLIIFTSNLGASSIYEKIMARGPGHELPSPEEVATHFEQAVREHFTAKLNRPELLGRIGNGVLAFDLLRPAHVDAIAAKFMDQFVASSARAGITLDLDRESILDTVRREMARPESLALGGRQVRNVLDRVIRDPLIDAVRQSGRRRGAYSVFVPSGEQAAVAIAAPSIPAAPLPVHPGGST
jgi:energy-coupling factor transporter ATP-binding protein EcfA2